MNGRTLARLLRLRQLQHDLAKVTLMRANESRADAEAEAIRRAEVLHSLHLPDRAEAATFLAMAASRQSAALAVRDSIELVQLATTDVHSAAAEWHTTRAAARGLERLQERQLEQERHDLIAREQREQDDRSASRATRGEDA